MKKIGIAINPTKDLDNKIVNMVKEKFSKNFDLSEVIVFNSFNANNVKLPIDIELVVVLGGDGTFLNVAREMSKKYEAPLIGINIGNLGFLSAGELIAIDMIIDKLKKRQYTIEKRMILKTYTGTDNLIEIGRGLNDIVVSRGTISRIIRFQIYIDNKLYSTFRGDGLIVSTPTGSTAYSYSAGGPIIYPNLDLITLTPICPHTRSMQTIVVGGDSLIEVIPENNEEEIYLTLDGQRSKKVEQKEHITIKGAKNSAKVIMLDNYDYFKVLRSKLLV